MPLWNVKQHEKFEMEESFHCVQIGSFRVSAAVVLTSPWKYAERKSCSTPDIWWDGIQLFRNPISLDSELFQEEM